MMNKKKLLVAASIAGLMASSSVALAGAAFPGHDSMNKSCGGVNGCKGAHGCKGMHSCKGGKHACSGGNNCPSKSASSAAVDASVNIENGQLTAK